MVMTFGKEILRMLCAYKPLRETSLTSSNFMMTCLVNETKIDFVLVEKDHQKYLKDVKVISGGLQYGLAVGDQDCSMDW